MENRIDYSQFRWRWHWRFLVCRRLLTPIFRRICGRNDPVLDVMRELDILEESYMYGGLCYKLPDNVLARDKAIIACMVLDSVRDYIRYNYLPDWPESVRWW